MEILEKVVFQSLKQFDTIIEKLESNYAEAYCHMPRRYYNNFLRHMRSKYNWARYHMPRQSNGRGVNNIFNREYC